ncbi:hydrolase [Lithospermum erythrorhizon]|uniref:Hydrolase n=1 Tax=Lithospermum erythrorhizon TaxID=34254 RepID=A0AAV3Q4C0_LITER
MEMVEGNQTSNKYLILMPEKASILEIFLIPFTSDIESKEFLDAFEVKEKILERKGIIFLSMIVRKFFGIMSDRMLSAGSKIEKWINLLSSDESLAKLIANYFRDNLVMPNPESARFTSIIGSVDTRVELANNIKPGDKRYFPALSALASKLAYENKAFIKATVQDRWKMEFVDLGTDGIDFWNEYQQRGSTQGFMLHDKTMNNNMIIVSFRGTEPFHPDSWSTDFDISFYKFHKGMGYVHSGFMKALGLQIGDTWPKIIKEDNNNNNHKLAYYTIRDKLKTIFKTNTRAKFILTGHSLGAALAVLFPAVLALHNEDTLLERLEAVYTFGQPRVGNEKFGNFMMEKFRQFDVKYYRFVYNNDIIPRVPFDNSTFMYKHFGTCIYYNSAYEGKIVEEAPEENCSLSSLITTRVDGVWELTRSFVLPYTFGEDYKESCLLKVLRVTGILVPEFVNHGTQDYINALQLGNDDIFDCVSSSCI